MTIQRANRKRRIRVGITLAWATAILFFANISVAAWMVVSPNFGLIEQAASKNDFDHAAKNSPFDRTVLDEKPKRVMLAARVEPIAQTIEYSPAVVSGAGVYEVMEAQMNRVTEAGRRLSEPLRRMTEGALRQVESRLITEPARRLQPVR